jgi:hypothetical protein
MEQKIHTVVFSEYPEDTVTMDMMMGGLGNRFSFNLEDIHLCGQRTVLEAGGARRAKRGAPIDLERGCGRRGSRRKEGSAGTIGLWTIFRTHGKAHDLQVIGKVSSK